LFFARERCGIKEGLHRGFAETPAPLMRARLVVMRDPFVEIGLQRVDRSTHPQPSAPIFDRTAS
jgi:hypothetical protein